MLCWEGNFTVQTVTRSSFPGSDVNARINFEAFSNPFSVGPIIYASCIGP